MAQPTAQVDCGLMQGQPRGGGPQFKPITSTPAAMTTVASSRHVHRERAAATGGAGLVQRTAAVRLRPRPTGGLESKQAEHLLHRDQSANSAEVNARHG